MNTKIYISGPMTGIKDYNRPLFREVEEKLKSRYDGIEVYNPGRIKVEDGKEYCDYFRTALQMLLECDFVVVLPGWKQSKGARLEMTIALALDMLIYEWVDEELREVEYKEVTLQFTESKSIEEEAADLINGERQEEYGPPEESFKAIALAWSGLFKIKVEPRIVALAMAMLKAVREANKPKRDNRVDGVAYWKLVDRLSK